MRITLRNSVRLFGHLVSALIIPIVGLIVGTFGAFCFWMEELKIIWHDLINCEETENIWGP